MVNAYKPFMASLIARTQLTPNYVRLTFDGPQLADFGDTCLDQRIKLIFDVGEVGKNLVGDDQWYSRWRALPDNKRPPMRTYTVRFVRPEAYEVDVDFVTHGTSGPASRFALEAPLGSQVIIIGPNARHPGAHTDGIAWKPGNSNRFLIAGDETALPAIANILRTLPATAQGLAAIEVPTATDEQPLDCPPGVKLAWLAREDTQRGDLLVAKVLTWFDANHMDTPAVINEGYEEIPASGHPGESLLWEETGQPQPNTPDTPAAVGVDGGMYTWIAAEAEVVVRLRRALRRDRNLPKKASAFMGYWREGHQLG